MVKNSATCPGGKGGNCPQDKLFIIFYNEMHGKRKLEFFLVIDIFYSYVFDLKITASFLVLLLIATLI